MSYKRILSIQDISCVGQCSLTVALPVLSACGHETCVLPTALLSTHTGGFGSPAVISLSSALPDIVSHWKQLGITFDLILVGYLGSIPAIHIAMDVIEAMGGIAVVDPAMADNGKLYSGFDSEYLEEMKKLCKAADIILPNLTEAAFLSGKAWEDRTDERYARTLADALPYDHVLLTGVGEEDTGFLLKEAGGYLSYQHPKLPGRFSGTGDMFAAAFAGKLASGESAYTAGKLASEFVFRSIEETINNPAHWYGVKFEPMLSLLARS